MQFVQGVEWVQALFFGLITLLPVDPPEVDALLLVRMMQDVQISARELVGGNVEWHWFLCGRVNADRARHVFVLRFVRVHTLGGVKVQRGFKIVLV